MVILLSNETKSLRIFLLLRKKKRSHPVHAARRPPPRLMTRDSMSARVSGVTTKVFLEDLFPRKAITQLTMKIEIIIVNTTHQAQLLQILCQLFHS
jgi:hypothetical protein